MVPKAAEAELLAAGDRAIAADFEFCPACRALEQTADVERDATPNDRPGTSGPDDELPDSGFYLE